MVEKQREKKSIHKTAFRDEKKELSQEILEIARVTRVMAGGKRMRFRACVGVGDKNGKVSLGIAKGADVMMAVTKATTQANKHTITVPIVAGTIPFAIHKKFGAAKILLKPAPKGTGVKAGGAVRVILELAGVRDVVGKILGSKNKINNAKATMDALKDLENIDLKRKEFNITKSDEKKNK